MLERLAKYLRYYLTTYGEFTELETKSTIEAFVTFRPDLDLTRTFKTEETLIKIRYFNFKNPFSKSRFKISLHLVENLQNGPVSMRDLLPEQNYMEFKTYF